MDTYINKEETIERINRLFTKNHDGSVAKNDYNSGLYAAKAEIVFITAADVQLMKRGRWEEEHYSELLWCYEATCSECGYESTDKYRITDSHRFCENCGAIMEPIMEQED